MFARMKHNTMKKLILNYSMTYCGIWELYNNPIKYKEERGYGIY